MPLFPGILPGSNLSFIQLLDSRSSGVAGGSFTANAWTPRTINTIKSDQTGLVTLSSNTFILPEGTYYLDAKAYFYLPNYAKLRLRNTTDNSTLLLGMTTFSYVASSGIINPLSGIFSIAASKNLQIQYLVNSSNLQPANTGDAAGFTVDEIYLTADFFKLS